MPAIVIAGNRRSASSNQKIIHDSDSTPHCLGSTGQNDCHNQPGSGLHQNSKT